MSAVPQAMDAPMDVVDDDTVGGLLNEFGDASDASALV